MTDKFYVTIGESVWNNRTHTRAFDSFDEFRRQYVGRTYVGDKGGRYITSAVLDGVKRKYENLDFAEWMIFDIDTGQPLTEIRESIEKAGLYALIWPTHSYGKTVSKVPVSKSNPVSYLLKDKSYRPAVLKKSVIMGGTVSDDEGREFKQVKHEPMEKWRVLLFLSEPFSFADERNECIAEWKTFYNSVGIWLGLDYDKAGERAVQPMFLPCKPEGEGTTHPEPFEIEGGDLDLDMVPITVVERTRATLRKAEASKKEWKGQEVPGLRMALARMRPNYDMIGFMADHVDYRDGGDNRIYLKCPNYEEHTCGDELDMEVRNQGNGYRGWRIGCFHSCNDLPEFDGDRARYLEAIMVEYDLTIDDLLDDAYLDGVSEHKDIDQLMDELQELVK